MTGPLTGRHVLIAIVTFFAIIFAVNGVFLYYAMESWPGLTTDHAYVEGLEYNKVLEAAEDQNLRGWHSEIAVEGETGARQVVVRLTDGSTQPLTGLAVELSVQRPVGDTPAMVLSAREIAPGVYRAEPADLGDGRWHVGVSAGDQYRMNHEVWISP